MDPQSVKLEPIEESDFPYGPEGLLLALKLEIPDGFERSE
jgi:hypothetical protein